jgi:hypothetical protein
MPDNFNDQDRVDLRPLKKVQEYIDKKALPRITPEEAQKVLQDLGKAKKTIEEILTNTIDPETGAVNATDGVKLADLPKEEHKAWADRLVARSLELEDELDALKGVMDARFEPIKDQLAVKRGVKDPVTGRSKDRPSHSGASDKLLRQSIRRVFGQNSTTISLDMYKEALELRDRMNKEDLGSALEDAPLKPGENIVTAKQSG